MPSGSSFFMDCTLREKRFCRAYARGENGSN